MDTSGKAFVDHWRWAAERGLLNKNTAAGLKAASAQVLGVLDGWQTVDVGNLDADDVVRRFKNLRKKDFRPKTLEIYGKRFKAALNSYRTFLEDPGNWRPLIQQRPVKAGRGSAGAKDDREPLAGDERAGKEALMEYPFPLRAGQTVRLLLPRDLKLAEVKRLQAFMVTLAVDSE